MKLRITPEMDTNEFTKLLLCHPDACCWEWPKVARSPIISVMDWDHKNLCIASCKLIHTMKLAAISLAKLITNVFVLTRAFRFSRYLYLYSKEGGLLGSLVLICLSVFKTVQVQAFSQPYLARSRHA